MTVPQPQEGPRRDCRILTLFAGVAQDLVDLGICRVLPQRPDDVTNLAQGDLGITSPVKEEEGLLEVCKGRATVKLSTGSSLLTSCIDKDVSLLSHSCSTSSRGVNQGNLWFTMPRKTPPL